MGDWDWHDYGLRGAASGLVVSFTKKYVGFIGESYDELGEPKYIRFGTRPSPSGEELDFAIEKVPADMEGARKVKGVSGDSRTVGVHSTRLIKEILEKTGIEEEELVLRARVWPDEDREHRLLGSLPIRDSE